MIKYKPKKSHLNLLLVLSLSLFISCIQDRVVEFELNENWMFKSAADSTWLKSTIPGSVHTDLITNKIIKDPYFGKELPNGGNSILVTVPKKEKSSWTSMVYL